ncbi:transposase [Streptomyces sp. NPDC001852]|uniref:transposase n=1 Tax=Streptomyces sp. NPDC001852 TaxID=3364619 RepID=UPI003677DBD5
MQNAEDLDATHVRILTKERELLVAHSGSPVRLPDETDALIGGRFRDHPHAEVILSMPGIGSVLAAEFIAHTGGDMSVFGTADRLAGVAGLAPVPKDSGRISGNMRRPRRYCRRLMRVFYMSAQVAARCCLVSKAYYERKRAEKKTHKQAVIALARRRLNVLWALLRDGRPFEGSPPLRAARLGSVKRAALSHIRW